MNPASIGPIRDSHRFSVLAVKPSVVMPVRPTGRAAHQRSTNQSWLTAHWDYRQSDSTRLVFTRQNLVLDEHTGSARAAFVAAGGIGLLLVDDFTGSSAANLNQHVKTFRKINGQVMETALSAVNVRAGLNVRKNPHPAVYPNGIEGMVSEGAATGSSCVRGAIARPDLTAQEIRA